MLGKHMTRMNVAMTSAGWNMFEEGKAYVEVEHVQERVTQKRKPDAQKLISLACSDPHPQDWGMQKLWGKP